MSAGGHLPELVEQLHERDVTIAAMHRALSAAEKRIAQLEADLTRLMEIATQAVEAVEREGFAPVGRQSTEQEEHDG